ncbi:hypothetical protein ACHAWX_003989 [Stephanocyclus meneghinianus]
MNGLPSPGNRQLKDASIERALRTISSPKRRSSSQKKSRKSVEKSSYEESVKVAIRIRPLASNSVDDPQCATRAFRASLSKNSVIETTDSSSKPSATPRRKEFNDGETEYCYDNVFGEETDNSCIYNDLVQDIVASVAKDGINGTIFTYGQTCSGKTFTMQGTGQNGVDGIIQLAAKDIFETIKQSAESCLSHNSESTVKVSYVEIYNEELRDLLTDNKRKSTPTSLNIREDKRGTITVENLKEVAVRSLDQLMEVFRVGEANKSIGSTKMNDRSSRSHAILKITIEKKTTINTRDDFIEDKENNMLASPNNKTASFVVKTSSSLNLVDLAGSESVRLTGATGMQKKEGGMINQSLLTLSKVLMSLGQKNPGHVNYRDSKLTRILKPSLSGNARMAVICCISPSDKFIEETRSTLQFATRAKLVKTNAVANEVVESDARVIAKLRLDLERAKLSNESLENQVRELELVAARLTTTSDDNNLGDAKSNDTPDQKIKKELANLKRFLFHDMHLSGNKIITPHSTHFTDQDINSKKFNVRSRQSETEQNSVKDDFCMPLTVKQDELLRIALAAKAKQVKELEEELGESRFEKRSSHSRLSLAAYQDIDQYKSQTEDLENKLANANSLISSLGRQIDELSSQKNDALDWIEELFEKSELKDKQVIQANKEKEEAIAQLKSLTADMSKTKQILEFTIGEKEEATSRMRAMKTEIDALKYCVNIDNSAAEGTRLLKNEIAALESNISAIKSERDELAALNDELRNKGSNDTNKIIELQHEIHMLKTNQRAFNSDAEQNVKLKEVIEELQVHISELTLQLQSHRDACCEYMNEKRALVERIEMAESELSITKYKLQAKSEELDHNVFSFESERNAMFKKIATLQEQIKATYCYQDEKRLLVERAEAAEGELSRVRYELQTKSQALDDAVHRYESEKENMNEEMSTLRDRAKELVSRTTQYSTDQSNSHELKCLKEENTKLKSEQSYFRRLLERNNNDADELRLMRLQLKTAQQNLVECNGELKAKEERLNLYERESHELRIKVESAQQRATKAEKAIVDCNCERVNSREQANQTLRKLRQTQKELNSLKQANLALQKRDSELRESVSRVRELVDGLASENSNLKEKSENYCRMLSERENRGRELENLFKSAIAERDAAVLEAKQLKASLLRSKESKEKMQCQIDSLTKAKEIALIDRERMNVRLDKMAADFEADYETLRDKMDALMKEKSDMEHQVLFLEASKASIEHNADRILERDNAITGQHDMLKAELKKIARALAQREDEIIQLTRRLDFLKTENERLMHDNTALRDAMKFSQHRNCNDYSYKKRKMFDLAPGQL